MKRRMSPGNRASNKKLGKGHPSAHVRTCSYAPPLAFAKSLAIGSLTSYQISAQSVQPFARYGKGQHMHVRKCTTPPMTCVICITVWSLNIPNFVTIRPSIPEL